jgi:hypothetical protein
MSAPSIATGVHVDGEPEQHAGSNFWQGLSGVLSATAAVVAAAATLLGVLHGHHHHPHPADSASSVKTFEPLNEVDLLHLR